MVKHGVVEVIGVEGHDYINGDRGRGAAVLAVAEGEGVPGKEDVGVKQF